MTLRLRTVTPFISSPQLSSCHREPLSLLSSASSMLTSWFIARRGMSGRLPSTLPQALLYHYYTSSIPSLSQQHLKRHAVSSCIGLPWWHPDLLKDPWQACIPCPDRRPAPPGELPIHQGWEMWVSCSIYLLLGVYHGSGHSTGGSNKSISGQLLASSYKGSWGLPTSIAASSTNTAPSPLPSLLSPPPRFPSSGLSDLQVLVQLCSHPPSSWSRSSVRGGDRCHRPGSGVGLVSMDDHGSEAPPLNFFFCDGCLLQKGTMPSATGKCWPSSRPWRNGVICSRGPKNLSWFGLITRIWNISALSKDWTLTRLDGPCSSPSLTPPSTTILVPAISSALSRQFQGEERTTTRSDAILWFPAELLSWPGKLKSGCGQPPQVVAPHTIYLFPQPWGPTSSSGPTPPGSTVICESEGLKMLFSCGFCGKPWRKTPRSLWLPVLSATSTNRPTRLLLASFKHSLFYIVLGPRSLWTSSLACPCLMASPLVSAAPPPKPPQFIDGGLTKSVCRIIRSPLARSNVGWSLLHRCGWGLQVFSTGAPGPLLSLHPRLLHLDWISWSSASPPLCAWSPQMLVCLRTVLLTLLPMFPLCWLTGTPCILCFVCSTLLRVSLGTLTGYYYYYY